MEAGPTQGGAGHWMPQPQPQPQDNVRVTGKASTSKRQTKVTKSKPDSAPPGTRYQCPRCPKNFSRIENLTRHQANHDVVGKFVCSICRKRFTRSDLLNRHRKIHGNQAEPVSDHVTHAEEFSESPQSENLGSGSGGLAGRENSMYVSQEGSSISDGSPQYTYQSSLPQRQQFYGNQSTYQQPAPRSDPSTYQSVEGQAHGLNSLMEAALAPQETFTFTPLENINPSLWDGFMVFGDNSNSYMGSYDADISWTLNHFQPDGSPNMFLDQDLMDFMENPNLQQPPMPQYKQPPQPVNPYNPSDQDADGDEDDEDQRDWPDKVGRPNTPHRNAQRVVPLGLNTETPASWRSVVDEARASGLNARSMRPYQPLNDQIRSSILFTLNSFSFVRNDFSRREVSDKVFPPSEALDYYLRLYFQHIQPRFPIIHLPTFDLYSCSPPLLLAMMFLGSSHSKADRGRFLRLFHERLRVACIRMQEVDPRFLRSVDNILTFFLLCLAGTWSGSKQFYEFAEGGRGILVTAVRRSRLLDCRPSARVEIDEFQRPGISQMQAAWLAWVETEKRKRLGLSIYIFDCQYPALFNNQPYVSKAETTNCVFPCSEEYWESPSAETWKVLVGPADMPPSTYYLHALNCCLLRKWVKPPPPVAKTNEFGKLILIYALHTHIFEWRQSCSMLNPTGLMGTFGKSALPLGEGLKERRRWLADGLDSWDDCYNDIHTSAAAKLLHRLGYVSLDVSLSDMHLVAGRSTHKHDGDFAQENLKHWANSELADNTMNHVYAMLEICHNCIAMGTIADSSYEIAVCLFTAGIVCWAYAKLRVGADKVKIVEQVRRASLALKNMGCWRMASMFGRILEGFEIGKVRN